MKNVKTKSDFDDELKNAGTKLVVVDFSAAWCGPCRMISPKVEAMVPEYPDVLFLKVDVDENSETAESEGISAMPTFKFYKNGKMIAEFTGANETKLKELIAEHK